MQVNALTGADQARQRAQRIGEPLGHRVRAAILDLRADEFDSAYAAGLGELAFAQSVERQVLVILEIVNGGHAEFRFEPGNIFRPGKFADQEPGRNLGDRGAAAKPCCVGLMLGSFAEPVHL